MLYPNANHANDEPVSPSAPAQTPSDVYDNPSLPYQDRQGSQEPQLSANSAPSSYYMAGPPPPYDNRPAKKRSSAGRAVALTMVLALLFGIVLFAAGWEFGRANSTTTTNSTGSSVGTLQPGTNPQVTVPALTGNNIDTVREAVIAKVRPSVVQVNVTTQRGGAIGSGVIIDKRGYIVTNNHVVSGAQSVQVVVYGNAKPLDAQIVGTDPADDLAVLKITPPANMVVATIGDSSKLQVGEDVLAIGNPLGITQTVTNGIISALGRSVDEGQGQSAVIPNAIQTDAPINPGNSGGALVDLQGNLIGIPTLSAIDPEFNAPANGVGFAIPSNRVSFIVPQIIQSGKVTHTGRAALGISIDDVTPALASQYNLPVSQGVLVAGLQSNGPAAQAGLQTNDIIVQINNSPVVDAASLSDALANKDPGNTVAVHVYRGSQQLTINVTLGELQAG